MGVQTHTLETKEGKALKNKQTHVTCTCILQTCPLKWTTFPNDKCPEIFCLIDFYGFQTQTHTHTRPVKASLLVVFHGPKNFVDVLSQTYTIYFHVSTVQHIEGYPAEFPYSSVWYNKITSPLWVVCHSPMSLSAASLGFISSKGNETASRRSSNA